MDILKSLTDAINKRFNVSYLLDPQHLILVSHLIVDGDDNNRLSIDRPPGKSELHKDNYLLPISFSVPPVLIQFRVYYEISWPQLINRLIYIAVSAQCNYSSLPFPLGPHSSLLFHVKHFLEKKCFFAQQSYRIFGKNPEILSG
jgi:hypothetical protein